MRRSCVLALTALLLFDLPAFSWWQHGHRVTARLAAYYLTPAARTRVAAILGVADNADSVADALAAASTWPDEIKKDRPETNSWHYIDIALQDKKDQIPERCPDQNCVTAQIDLDMAKLKSDRSAADQTADAETLKFLIHFVGDIHQPLHASSDADLGGNCEPLSAVYEKAKNLHALWDGPLVDHLNPDDKVLARSLQKELEHFGKARQEKMSAGTADDWAWESHKVAQKVIYKKLRIPTEPVVFPASCTDAPAEIQADKIAVTANYVNAMKSVVRLQLERGGLRLARLLNEM